MAEHSYSISLGRSSVAVIGVLASRPSSWLRPFMQLALRQRWQRSPSPASAGSWHRVGRLQRENGGATVTLNWWPHVEGDVFRRFLGCFTVVDTDEGCILTLSGITIGGQATRTTAVLRDLLRLLGEAMSLDQLDGG